MKKKMLKTKATKNANNYKQYKVTRSLPRNSQLWTVFGGLEAILKPQEAIWGSGGKAPNRQRLGGLWAEPPALEIFAFFF